MRYILAPPHLFCSFLLSFSSRKHAHYELCNLYMLVVMWLWLTALNEIHPPPHTHYLPPHKSELTFKPCHTLPLMSSAQSEAAVTFWSLRFSIPFSTGALQENNLMLVAPAIDISNSGFRSYFSGSGYPFLPSQLNVSHLGQDQICMRG